MALIASAYDLHGLLSGGSTAVLAYYSWRANKDGFACPGVATAARDLNINERTLRRHTAELEALGLMLRARRHVEHGRDKGRRLTDGFLVGQAAIQQAGISPARQPGKLSASRAGPTGHFDSDNRANCQGQPGNLSSAYKDEPSTEPRKRTQNHKRESSKNFSAGGERKKSGTKGRSTRSESDRIFDGLFWESFPRKTSIDAARREFCKAIEEHRATADQLVQGARRYAEYVSAAETQLQYVKAPDRWLRDGCWKDDLTDLPRRNGHGKPRDALAAVVAKIGADFAN